MSKTFLFLLVFFTSSFLVITFLPVNADFLYSPNYQIQAPNVNIGSCGSSGSSQCSSTNYKIASTLGQTAAEKFSSAGYVVRAGFQYIEAIAPFSFKISNTNIAFGSLTPSSFSTQTTNLTVGFSSANGYQVTAIENNSLQTFNAANTIPDTSCDSGTTCTTTSANTWTSTSSYGFGYNMTATTNPNYSVDIPSDFFTSGSLDSNKYRSFDTATARVVMSNSPSITTGATHLNRNDTRVATMSFKINVSGAQAAGTYTTVVRLTATPLY